MKKAAPKKNESSDDESGKDYGSESEDEADSEEGEVAELTAYVKPVIKDAGRARQSVSAEAFGKFNVKEDFKAPFYQKSAEENAAIKTRLG